MKRLHFIGAGGIGVSALAGISMRYGHAISGCDRAENDQTAMLRQLGAEIFIGHDPAHVTDSDEVIYTSAMPADHPELLAAGSRKRRRGEFLAALMRECKGVGICGTHGKTTTTWMVAHILISCGLDPTVLVGGEVSALNGNFRTGGGCFVSELDESDGSFLLPDLAVGAITNIESEHLAYYGTLEKVVKSFGIFSDKLNGHLSLNLDCPYSADIYRRRRAPKSCYGLKSREGYHWREIEKHGRFQTARLYCGQAALGRVELPFPGAHNLYNSLCAVSVTAAMGVEPARALDALRGCVTVGRRMEYLGEQGGVTFYSDYAHHPTEVTSALSGAREFTKGKMLVVFQPHLYSRTRDYAPEFAQALTAADRVMLVELYPARELPIPGVDSGLIGRHLTESGRECARPVAVVEIEEKLTALLTGHPDIETVIFMGAGNIDQCGREYASGHVDRVR